MLHSGSKLLSSVSVSADLHGFFSGSESVEIKLIAQMVEEFRKIQKTSTLEPEPSG